MAIAAILLFLTWCVLGWLVVPGVIHSAYNQESYPLLNRAISGRDVHPVEKYLTDWKRVFLAGSLVLAACAVGTIGLTRRRVRTGIRAVATAFMPADAKQLTQWLAIGIAVLVVVQCCVAVAWGELLSDGAFYLTLARHVARGDVPYHDLPTTYAPGSSYIFAVLGPDGVSNPRLAKAYFFCVYPLNALLVFSALRQLKHAPWLAALGASVFATWTLAADGTAILLEPYQVVFILLGLNALLRWSGVRGGLLAGLAVGASLMVKQYSLMAVPVMAWMSLMPWSVQEDGEEHSLPICWSRCVAFLVSLGVPWLLFALLTGQQLAENFVAVATFGGAAGDYPPSGVLEALRALTYGQPSRTVGLVVACMGLGLVCMRPSRANLQIFVGYMIWFPMLAIRTYPHYFQLAIPWGILLALQFSRVVAKPISQSVNVRYTVALLALLPCLLVVFHPIHLTRYYLRKQRVDDQLASVDRVRQVMPERENVICLNAIWFYLLADVEAPRRTYPFLREPNERYRDFLNEAECIAVFPKRSKWMMPVEQATKWLAEEGWILDRRVELPDEGDVLLFRRSGSSDQA